MPEAMTLDVLQAVAELAPQPAISNGSQQRTQSTERNDSAPLQVADWLNDRGVKFRLKDSPTSDSRNVYLLDECPFDSEHGQRGEVCIMQDAFGKLSFKCHHNACNGHGWQDAKAAIGKPGREHYDRLPAQLRSVPSAVGGSFGRSETYPELPPGTRIKALDRDNIGTVVEDLGQTCRVEFVSPDGRTAFRELPKTQLRDATTGRQIVESCESFRLPVMTASEFASASFRQHYFVKRVLVEGQPGIIGGPKKCLKTGTLVDLAISLGTGTPFLSHPEFLVPERVRTCVLSGESGGFTLQETANRICKARNRLLNTADVHWGFTLPQLANPEHLDVIGELVTREEIRVLIIDPAYLCLLSGTQGINPGDVFAMGGILKELGELGTKTGCTILIAHHTRKKDRRERSLPTDLDDLSMSGFAEFARQWLLLGRRSEYRGDGKHDLWLNVGGSAGHAGSYVLSVDEGVINDGQERYWETRIESASDAIEAAKQRAEERRNEAAFERRQEKLAALNETLRRHPNGETKTRLRNLTTPQPSASEFEELIDDLIRRGATEPCQFEKNGRTERGFRPVSDAEKPSVSDGQ